LPPISRPKHPTAARTLLEWPPQESTAGHKAHRCTEGANSHTRSGPVLHHLSKPSGEPPQPVSSVVAHRRSKPRAMWAGWWISQVPRTGGAAAWRTRAGCLLF